MTATEIELLEVGIFNSESRWLQCARMEVSRFVRVKEVVGGLDTMGVGRRIKVAGKRKITANIWTYYRHLVLILSSTMSGNLILHLQQSFIRDISLACLPLFFLSFLWKKSW